MSPPRAFPAALAALALAGCTLQSYEPQPLDPEATVARLQAREAGGAGLKDFVARHGFDTSPWPPPRWGLEGLTLMALYHHPDMAVARAELAAREAAETTARQYPNPALAPLVEHHSDTEGRDGPWSLGFAIDIPIENTDRRTARIARAAAMSEEARLAVAEAAWGVRSRLRRAFIDLYAATRTAELLRRQRDTRRREVALVEKRRALGEAGPTEVSLTRLRLQEAELAVANAEGRIATSRAALAEALGMPLGAVRGLEVSFAGLAGETPAPLPAEAVRRAALTHRLDVRQAEWRYAQAEARLELEIARQIPEVTVSPNFLWDQGDAVKALGAALLLPVMNLNEGPIAEARAARRLEEERFSGLQARIMGELDRAGARYEAAVQAWETAQELVETQRARLRRAEKLFSYGETDRLDVVTAEGELIAAQRGRLAARVEVLHALGAVEDAVQRPLYGEALWAEAPAGGAEDGGADESAPAGATAP